MTSSSLAGDRRWGSGRRGGMTVLGKVAVPKPLNLPSQRLENHGLDPNVEIVPKGTLSWGSRTSSSVTNAWGSSSLSPSADGSANSPSHLSGRPSSGGSGTRPSTSGSDRLIEPTGNAWGPNSRPSSASGAFASNQSSTISLRPRSAETRPASSQLSRFAEPVSDSPGAWGSSGTADRLGVISSKRDEFSLSSGDFPTLGSDKDDPGKRMESKDPGSHSRPSSASGREAQTIDKTLPSHADNVGGAVNTWRKDGSQSVGDVIQPNIENWQGDPQQYFNPNVPPQHFDAWRGPPMNAPGGVWYRGPPGGPPYGAPVAPGGFPMEPFPYFRPQIPPPAFANSQPVPPPRGGPRAHRPKGGNAYRPQTPDAYVHPGMPFRPGFYPPPMAFEGYYGPPMGYCNSTERDVPFMGMGAGPSVYDRCSAPNAPNSSDSHARVGGPGPSGKPMLDNVESVYSGDVRGPYKDLTKQQNERDGKAHGENRDHMQPASTLHPVKGQKAGIIPRKYEWGAEDDGEEDMYSSHNFDNEGGHVSVAIQAKSSQSSGSMKPVDDCSIKKSDSVTSSPSQVPQESTSDGRDSALPSTIKSATLMQKIEGLNAKVRAADGRVDCTSGGEEQICDSNTINAVVDTSTNKAGRSSTSLEGNSVSGYFAPMSHGVIVSARDRKSRPTVAMSRKPHHGMSGGIDHRGKKGKFSHQDADGWQRKPVTAELPDVVSASNFESAYNVQGRDPHQPVDAAMNNPPAKDEAELVAELHDSMDSQVQRAKMRDLAKQRAIQLEKEEEERTREQKAKALAKLEELNRRTQSSDASNQTTKKPPASEISKTEQEGRNVETRESVAKLEASTPVSPLKTEVVSVIKENSGNQVIGSAIPSQFLPVEISKTMKSESVPRDESVSLKQDANASATDGKFSPRLNQGSGSRLKGTSYNKQKQNTVLQKNLNEKSIAVDAVEAQKSPVDISLADGASNVDASIETGPSNQSCLPNSSVIVSELSAPQRRKSNKSIKDKNKQDDVPYIPTSMATVPGETVPPKTSEENVKSQASNIAPCETIPPKTSEGNVKFQASILDLNFGSIPAAVYGETGVELLEQVSSLPSEEAHGKVSQWKPHQSRRMPRNQQSNRFVDKFHGSDAVVWAPVRSQNKAGNNSEATGGDQKLIAETVTAAKCESVVQNSLKSKRAEMERYVPKPFAKELAQQAGIQNPDVSSVNISAPDQTGSQQSVVSATGNIGSPVQSKEGFAKHNKQGKVHGAWRQRGSTEFSDVKNVQQVSSSTSNPHKNSQEAILKNHPSNEEANSAQAEEKTSSGLNASDSQVVSSNSDAFASDTSGPKDQGVAGKGSRHSHRGHRNVGNSHNNDNKNIRSAETERTHIRPDYDMNQSDIGIGSKETRGTGESLSSHWQPKSHANSVSSQKGSRITGSQDVGAEAGRLIKKDHPRQQRVKTPPENSQESNETLGIELDQCVSENKVVAEVPKAGNHEPRRERKLTSSKGRPYSPNQNHIAADESGPAVSIDARHERPFSAGSRRHGNQISRSGRGHESRGEWSMQDNRQHNMPTNRDRQRYNMHYEYQPVGSYNNTKNTSSEGLADGSRNAGPRYRERGQSYPKRGGGNFHGRQSRLLQVDAGCD